MQALIGYNRKLAWVVVPAIVWACLGVAVALGPPPGQPPPGGKPPLRFGIGPSGGGVFVKGAVKRIAEADGRLVVTIEAPPGAEREFRGRDGQPVRNLPPGLAIEFAKPGDYPDGPPQIELRSGQHRARKLPGGGAGILTQRFLLKYDAKGVRIVPRPRDFAPPRDGGPGWGERRPEREQRRDRLREGLRDRMEQRREGGQGHPPENGEQRRPPRDGRGQPGQPPPDGAPPPAGPPGR